MAMAMVQMPYAPTASSVLLQRPPTITPAANSVHHQASRSSVPFHRGSSFTATVVAAAAALEVAKRPSGASSLHEPLDYGRAAPPASAHAVDNNEDASSPDDARPQHNPHKKRRKECGAPTRSKTAYIVFMCRHREEVRAAVKEDETGTHDEKEVIRRLAAMWKCISPEEFESCMKEAERDEERYRREMTEYKTKPPSVAQPNSSESVNHRRSAQETTSTRMRNAIAGNESRHNNVPRLAEHEDLILLLQADGDLYCDSSATAAALWGS